MNQYQTYSQSIYERDYFFKTNDQNIFQIPKLSKIIIHSSIGSKLISLQEKKKIAATFVALEMISGQKSKKTRSKNFIAGFKLRKGQLVGCYTSLRRNQMFFFLQKLLVIILPKIRDFNGFTLSSLHTNGNLSFGLQNILLFPELENNYEVFESICGIQIHCILKSSNKNSFSFIPKDSTVQKKKNFLFLSGMQIPFLKN